MNVDMRHNTVFIMTEPVDTQDVVVFNQALPGGTILDASMLSVVPYPRAIVPQITFGHDVVLGSVLTGDVAPDTVLVADMIAGAIPEGMVEITIPADRYLANDDLRTGQIVNIAGSVRLPTASPGETPTPGVGLDYIERMRVVYASELGVTVAGLRGDVRRLQAMLDSRREISITVNAEESALAGSRVDVRIPVIRIWVGSPMDVGQQVNVMSSRAYADPSAARGEATQEAGDSQLLYMAAADAIIVAVDDNQITLNIHSEDAERLNWYVDSDAPMLFEAAS